MRAMLLAAAVVIDKGGTVRAHLGVGKGDAAERLRKALDSLER